MAERTDLLRGTLDLLVLRVLERGPSHGYAIARRIERDTDDVLRVEEGSLYPALYRLQRRGLVRGSWTVTETGRRAKCYELTDAGREHLRRELLRWRRFSGAVTKLLRAT